MTMKKFTTIKTASILAIVSSGLLAITGCSTTNIQHGIPNLAMVEQGVWRGGQPNSEGWAWLKSQGVTYDVKLNTWDEASDKDAMVNGIFVQDDGIINFEEQTIGKPNSYALASAVQSLINHAGVKGEGVFIHCEHGQDRTGLVIGAYRVTAEGWSKEDAYREMRTYGFHPMLRGLVRAWDEDVQTWGIQ